MDTGLDVWRAPLSLVSSLTRSSCGVCRTLRVFDLWTTAFVEVRRLGGLELISGAHALAGRHFASLDHRRHGGIFLSSFDCNVLAVASFKKERYTRTAMSMKHLAIIPDGNRRWAKDEGLPSFEGHRRGYEAFKVIGEAALERGIQHMSFWAFSTENWKRTEEEVGYLMDLLLHALTKDVDFYHEKGIRLKVIGRREGLSEKILRAIESAEAKTDKNVNGQINILLNYGGQAEIVDAVKELVASGVAPEDVTEELIGKSIWLKDVPSPDLIIRTSGEQRLSGFMSWSGAYSELLFVEKHWPAFTEEDLDAAITNFEQRERRFGGDAKKPSA